MLQQLLIYSEACRAVAAAATVDEAKDIHDRAEAVRAYAHQAGNRKLEIDASEIRVRAERRLGEMLLSMKRDGVIAAGRARLPLAQQRPRSRERKLPPDKRIRIETLGISSTLSSASQLLAKQSAENFEINLGKWRRELERNPSRKTTTHAVTKAIRPPSKPLQDRSVFWFKMCDGTPIGRLETGKLRSRISACEAELRLLRSLLEHAQSADALAPIAEIVTEARLREMISAAATS